MRPILVGLAVAAIVALAGIGYELNIVNGSARQATQIPSSTSSVTKGTSTNSSVVVVIIPKDAGVFGGPNFTPSNITLVIGVNNTVRWVNEDNLSAHSVTALEVPTGFPKFDPIIIDPGQTISMKLTVPGTYVYYCLWHPGWLRGTITVKA